MEPCDHPLPPGSITEVSQRLALWARRAPQGFARVEYSSEFSRQQVLTALRQALLPHQLTVQEISLPSHQTAEEITAFLLAALAQSTAEVVAVTGFATAFNRQVSLAAALQGLNFHRERLHVEGLRQIWWMTPVFLQTAIHAMPDLNSWFSLRLTLTESLAAPNQADLPRVIEPERTGAGGNIEDARQRANNLIQRFAAAQNTGATDQELLTTYLLPALEALAEVGAQRELRDLTGQFEGWLGRLQQTDTADLAFALDRLARLYELQGRYSEAEPLYQQALALRQRLLGDDHPAVATSLNNLAALYRSQGRYSEAEPLYQQALALRQRLLGDDHPDVATSLNNLAALYRSQGRYSEAEPLYQQALALRQRLLGDDHPDVATSLNNLALLYDSQGRYSEAEPLYQQALALYQRLLGDDHPHVATSLNNLAGLYYSQGRYSEAEPLYQQALALSQRLLGDDHPDVATSLNNLAGLYDSQGRYSEAEPLYQQALALYQRLLGDDHPHVASTLWHLGVMRYHQGQVAAAAALLLRALPIYQAKLGDHHPDTQNLKSWLAEVKSALLQEASGSSPGRNVG